MPYPEHVRAITPHSLEAEESVIGGVLVHQRKLGDIVTALKPDDFYHPALRAIYEAMLELAAASKPVDALTVVEQMRALETFDKLRAFNGPEYLTELMSKVVTVENIGYHARIVRDKARRRRMFETYRELAAAACAESDDAEYFADAQRRTLEIMFAPNHEDGARRPIKAVLHEYMKLLENRYEHKGQITGMPTGYADLDALLCGLQDTDYALLAGRPSMGKTAIAMNIAANAALADYPVLVFSLEMSRAQLAERALAGEARVDSQRLRTGSLEVKHWMRLTSAAGRLSEIPMQVIDRSMTLAEICSEAQAWRMEHKLDANGAPPRALVVLDYVQLIATPRGRGRRDQSRERDVSEISAGLKQLTKTLRCPVLALSQLNRGLESRPDKRPLLSDLRDSGSLEQDADVVAFVYRDEVYSKEECKPEDKGVAEIIVRKQRMGPLATVRLTFLDAYTRFETMSNRSSA
jgi:replicative DNA helicase